MTHLRRFGIGLRSENVAGCYTISGYTVNQLMAAYLRALESSEIFYLELDPAIKSSSSYPSKSMQLQVGISDSGIADIDSELPEALLERLIGENFSVSGCLGRVSFFSGADLRTVYVVEAYSGVVIDGVSLLALRMNVFRHLRGIAAKGVLAPEHAPRRGEDVPRDALEGESPLDYWDDRLTSIDKSFKDEGIGVMRVTKELDAKAVANLKWAAERLGVTCEAIMLAAHLFTAARFTGNRAVAVSAGNTSARSDAVGNHSDRAPIAVRASDWGETVDDLSRFVGRELDLVRIWKDGCVWNRPEVAADWDAVIEESNFHFTEIGVSALPDRVESFPGWPLWCPRNISPGFCTEVSDLGERALIHMKVPVDKTGVRDAELMWQSFLAFTESAGKGLGLSDPCLFDDATRALLKVNRPREPVRIDLVKRIVERLRLANDEEIVRGTESIRSNELLSEFWYTVNQVTTYIPRGGFVCVDDTSLIRRIAALLACLYCGRVYVPRVARILSEEGYSHGILGETEMGSFTAGKTVELGSYAIETSGTTGRSRLVLASLVGLNNLIAGESVRFGLSSSSNVLLVSSPLVDPWICHVLGALYNGASLVQVDPRNVSSLVGEMRSYGVSHAFLPAVLARQIEWEPVPTLEILAIGGERISSKDLQVLPACRHFNIYGPTENTVTSCVAEVGPQSGDPVPVGSPISGCGLVVVNEQGWPLPPGVIGEVWVSGVGVSLGYVGDIQATTNAFCTSQEGFPVYKTGDLGHVDSGGCLYIQGRKDRQIKIRGYRVEMEGIESSFRETGYKDAYAYVDSIGTTNRIVVVVEGVSDPQRESLAKQGLPDIARPALTVPIGKIPRKSSGAVNHKEVCKLVETLTADARSEPDGKGVVAENKGILDRAWYNALGRWPRAADNFVDLGGDSLTALIVASECMTNGIFMSASDILNTPTFFNLKERATLLGPASRSTFDKGPPSIATFGPAQAWAIRMTGGRVPRWGMRAELALDGVRESQVDEAIEWLLDRHPILGWRIDSVTGFDATAYPPLPCGRIGFGGSSKDLRAALRDDLAIVADGGGPLLSATISEVDTHRLILTAHHFVVDVWSWHIITRELSGYLDNRPSAVITPTTWQDYCSVIEERDEYFEDLAYWTEVLEHSSTRPSQASVPRWVRAHETIRAGGVGSFGLIQILACISFALTQINGPGITVIDLERNGRAVDLGIDLSSVVGWIAGHHPIAIRHEGNFRCAEEEIRGQLKAVPNMGQSYGWLRWYKGALYSEKRARMSVDILFDDGELGLGRSWSDGEDTLSDPSTLLNYEVSVQCRISRNTGDCYFVTDYDVNAVGLDWGMEFVRQVRDVAEIHLLG